MSTPSYLDSQLGAQSQNTYVSSYPYHSVPSDHRMDATAAVPGPRKVPSVARLICLTKAPSPDKHVEAKAIDIIAVHGLCGKPGATGLQDGIQWLRELAPKDIRGARVFDFDYDVQTLFTGSREDFKGIVKCLLDELLVSRAQIPPARPLVFVCHGFGGLVVEEAITLATAGMSSYSSLRECVKAIIFLGAPQRESLEMPWSTMLYNLARESFPPGTGMPQDLQLDFLRRIDKNAEVLHDIPSRFLKLASSIKIVSCYDRVPIPPHTECSMNKSRATFGVQAEKRIAMSGCTHQSLVTFSSRDDENYKSIIHEIKKVLKSAVKTKEGEVTAPELGELPGRNTSTRVLSQSRTPGPGNRTQQPQLESGNVYLQRPEATKVSSSQVHVYSEAKVLPGQPPKVPIMTPRMGTPSHPTSQTSRGSSHSTNMYTTSSTRVVEDNNQRSFVPYRPQNSSQYSPRHESYGFSPYNPNHPEPGTSAQKGKGPYGVNVGYTQSQAVKQSINHSAVQIGSLSKVSIGMPGSGPRTPQVQPRQLPMNSQASKSTRNPKQIPENSVPRVPQAHQAPSRPLQQTINLPLRRNASPMSQVQVHPSSTPQRGLQENRTVSQEKPGFLKKLFGSSSSSGSHSQPSQKGIQQSSPWPARGSASPQASYGRPSLPQGSQRPAPKPQPQPQSQPQSHYGAPGRGFSANNHQHWTSPQVYHPQGQHNGSGQGGYHFNHQETNNYHVQYREHQEKYSAHEDNHYYNGHEDPSHSQGEHDQQPTASSSGSGRKLAAGMLGGLLLGGIAGAGIATAISHMNSDSEDESETHGGSGSNSPTESDTSSHSGSEVGSDDHQSSWHEYQEDSDGDIYEESSEHDSSEDGDSEEEGSEEGDSEDDDSEGDDSDDGSSHDGDSDDGDSDDGDGDDGDDSEDDEDEDNRYYGSDYETGGRYY